ncbi:MAG: L,D-transpeptidase [Lachnospiraceae bacterium]|nr:L,D-transpeptidase [Lachnospiraceae bacterium]
MSKAKRILITVLSSLAFLLLLCVGLYFYGVFYFRHWFCPNTYINGVNVSLKDYSVCDEILKQEIELNDLIIVDEDGSEIVAKGEDIYSVNVDEVNEAIATIKAKDDPHKWVICVFNPTYYSYKPSVYLDEEKLLAIVSDSELSKKERFNENNKAEIIYTKERGFELVDNTKDLLDWDMCQDVIVEAGANEAGVIYLSDLGVYKSLKESSDYKDIYDRWNKLHKAIEFDMTYTLATGEEVKVDSAAVSSFLLLDENNEVVFDEDDNAMLDSAKILAFVQDMSDKYDNMYTDKKFKTTRGDVVTIPYSRYTTYGSLINVRAEAEELEKIVASHESPGKREPIYIKKEDKGTYNNNYGGTYVEVDVTGQHMYYYVNNELAFDTDVVTGCKSNGNMTPDCVCYIVNKARNITLIGPGYASFVYYWMCITGQIGIHDATWRRTFGGEIYLYGGSHGCVNTPIDKMKELFDMIEIGTPVIVHR